LTKQRKKGGTIMKRILSILLSSILVLTLLTACGSTQDTKDEPETTATDSEESKSADDSEGTEDATAPEGADIKIGLVMKSLANPFFIYMDDAAQEKAKELGIELISLSPDKETEVEKQVQIVENLIAQNVDAICLVPCGSKELIPAIKKANEANIPVLILDTRVDADAMTEADAHVETFIGSDNYLGGEIAAEELAEALGTGSKVGVLEGIGGHESSENRVGGFRDKAEEMGVLEIVASQPANWEQEQGYTVMQNMLQANPDIAGVFAANDLMALGAIKAIEDAGKIDEIKVVGFDAQDEAKVAIQEGKMLGSIAQYPDIMGATGIEKALAVINGDSIETEIPVEVGMLSIDDLQ